MAMEQPMSVEELTEHVGIVTSALDQRCSEEHLGKIAKKISNWEQYAKPLGLSDQHIRDIKTDNNLEYGMKALRVLEKWKKRNAFKATYKNLIRTFLDQNDAELAEQICKLLKVGEVTETTRSSPTTTAAGNLRTS